jgi:hypothetical protein
LEDEERGGLESEDISGTILDEDDFGGSTAEECDDSIPEEAPGLTSSADDSGVSAVEELR